MHILEIETVGRGGLIHYVHNLSCALAERGHDVTVVTAAAHELEGMDMPGTVRLMRTIARWTHRARRRLPPPLLALARKVEALVDAVAVARLARRLRPDIIHLHCTNQIALAYLMLLRPTGIPVAVTAHVVTAHERGRVEDAARRRIHALSPLIIAHSEFDRKRLIDEFAVEPTRVVVLPHGEYGFFVRGTPATDRGGARRSLGLAPTAETALFFGYIREYKGLDILLDAWPEIVKARPAARLVVAGDPVRLEPARRRALEVQAERVNAVQHFGYLSFADVPRYFAAADVLVLPYRHVSQSGVLFLALALGLPVVATRVGALPEVVSDGDSALLVPPESPAALAGAVTRVLSDPALRARLAANGRRIAADYSWPSIAARTESVFAGLVSRGRGSR